MLSKFLTILGFAATLVSSIPLDSSQLTFPSTDGRFQIIDVAVPVEIPTSNPCATIQLVDHKFYGAAPVFTGSYTPPTNCSGKWSKVIIKLVGQTDQNTYDNRGGLWIGGAEILRTSSPESSGRHIEWHVEKDISSVIPILKLKDKQDVVMYFDNYYSESAAHHITVLATFYPADEKNPQAEIADQIIPISNPKTTDVGWFDCETEHPLNIPSTTYKAVLEVYASAHDIDEFWYDHRTNKYPGGPYREIQVIIDNVLAGVAAPFPTIYTGGYNFNLWYRVPSIRAFNMLPYYFDITPFIGMLHDTTETKDHKLRLTVSSGMYKWLLDANLQLWLDNQTTTGNNFPTNYYTTFSPTVNSTYYGAKRILHIDDLLRYSGGDMETVIHSDIDYNNSFLTNYELGNWNQKASETHTITKKLDGNIISVTTLKDDVSTFGRIAGVCQVTTIEINQTSSADKSSGGNQKKSKLTIHQRASGKLENIENPRPECNTGDSTTNLTYSSSSGACLTWDVKVVNLDVTKNITSSACGNKLTNCMLDF